MWWDSSYPLRRKLLLVPPPEGASAGQPVTFDLPAVLNEYNKVLSDGSDLEAVYQDDDDAYHVLDREVIFTEELPDKITFALFEDLLGPTDRYSIYYGNPSVAVPPSSFDYSEWHNREDETSFNLTFTRPGEHWNEQSSSTPGARAAFRFYGDHVRMVSDVGRDQGIAEISVDEGPWEDVDLYSVTPQEEVIVWSKEGLVPGEHLVHVRVSGRQTPASSGYNVNIRYFEYLKYVDVIDEGEVVDVRVWDSVIGGSSE